MGLVNILQNISVFNGMSYDDFEKIIPLLEEIKYDQNSQIIKEGEQGLSMFILIKGSVKVTKNSAGNEEILINYLYPGSYFGEIALIDNIPRSANVTSVEETEMLRLRKSEFDTLLNSDQKIANIFYKNTLTETFKRFRNNLSNFTFSQHVLKEKTETLEEINKDLSLARQVQDFFISTELESTSVFSKHLKHNFLYRPCSEVGGDFLNIYPISDTKLALMIADVVGHGVTAAMATGVLKTIFSFIVDDYGSNPAEFMHQMNKHYFKVMSKLYATCYYAVIDTEEKNIKMSKAGHHHPLFWRNSLKDFETIETVGTGLGILQSAKYTEAVFPIESGDKILFYTDGILEERNNKKEMYSENRLISKYRFLIEQNSNSILKDILSDLVNFSGNKKFEDDITLMHFEIL